MPPSTGKRYLVCLLLCTGLAFATNLFNSGEANVGDFEKFKSLSAQPTASAYFNAWGAPDAFLISFLPSRSKQGRLELWIYAKQGIEILVQDGVRIKDFFFNPSDASKLSASTELRPDGITQEMSMAEVRDKFGKPTAVSAKPAGAKRFTTFEFESKSPKYFSFIDSSLAFVSAGMSLDAKNPWSQEQSPPKDSALPTDILGNWKSNLGEVTLKQSASNPGFFEGVCVTNRYLKGTAPTQGTGIIREGTIDKRTGFVRCSIPNWDGHAEFFISPDRKTMIGSMFNKDHGSNSVFYWRWILTR